MTKYLNGPVSARPLPFWLRPIAALVLLAAGIGIAGHEAPTAYGEDQPSYVSGRSVRVTYHFPTGNATASGRYPFVGSAACSWEMPFGTLVWFPDGRIVVCIDRGMLGNDGWVDVYAPDKEFGLEVEKAYGGRTTVRLILPPGGKLEVPTPKPGTPTSTPTAAPGAVGSPTPRPGR